MPATPTLLLKLRETLGDEAANDLVTWVEQSSDRDLARLRDLAELYYQRFDARLEQRLAEFKAELRAEFREQIDALRRELGGEVTAARREMSGELASVKRELNEESASLRVALASQRSDLVKWMFIFWAGTVLPLAGLLVALVRL